MLLGGMRLRGRRPLAPPPVASPGFGRNPELSDIDRASGDFDRFPRISTPIRSTAIHDRHPRSAVYMPPLVSGTLFAVSLPGIAWAPGPIRD
jgi:hypothetical protein